MTMVSGKKHGGRFAKIALLIKQTEIKIRDKQYLMISKRNSFYYIDVKKKKCRCVLASYSDEFRARQCVFP